MEAIEHGDPRRVGRCQIQARIGSGGMGIVYLGQSGGGRAVAIKVMHAEFADDREYRVRFQREVAATRAVRGGCSPAFIDAGPDASTPWLATEFLPSVSLREAVQKFGALPTDAVWSLAAGLAGALAAIHRAGIVHLDLKPANVLLTAAGPRVIDFGIAQRLTAGMVPRTVTPAGSRGYMSPEQVSGSRIGPWSDVYSFGSTLAYACTGVTPSGEQPPRLDGIADVALRTMVADCMSRDPAARPTVFHLIRRLASVTRDGSGSGTLRLPSTVTAEIDLRASQAENPPPPPPPVRRNVGRRWHQWRPSRRALLFGTVGVVGVAVAGGSARGLAADSRGTWVKPPAPSPSPKTRPLEFLLTGNITLTSLTCTVNGQTTTLTNVKLPWQKIVDVPLEPEQSTWQLAYRFPRGEVTYRVLIDDFLVESGMNGSTRTRVDKYLDGIV